MLKSASTFWSAAILLGAFAGFGNPAPLAWAAWLVPCAGWHMGARGALVRPLGGVFVALGVLCGMCTLGLYGPGEAALAWVALGGLLTITYGMAKRFRGANSALSDAALLGVFGLVLTLLPTGGGLLVGGWAKHSPQAAGFVMDVSPAVFVVEAAGVDLLRLPLFYESDTTDFIMGTRRPWNTPLAPIVLLVVGCALALLPSKPRPSISQLQ